MYASIVRRTYRILIGLYPAQFRREFGPDLLLVFDELLVDRGVVTATTRTSVDLIVTVPRYRLEAVMSTANSDRTLSFIAFALPTLGLVALLSGLPWVGLVMIAVGVLLALVGGGRIARSIRTAAPAQRARRLRASGLCALLFLVCVGGYAFVISDDSASSLGLLITSVPGTIALVGAVVLLIAGLLTPRAEQGLQSSAA